MEDNTERVKQDIRTELAKRLIAAAIMLQQAEVQNLATANPPPHNNPAPRGQYPRGRTWNLRSNVVFAPSTIPEVADSLSIQVGYRQRAFYGAVLGKRGWKWLADTAVMLRPRIALLFANTGSAINVREAS